MIQETRFQQAPLRRLPMPEFIAMLAFLFATIAFSIDAMLPALPLDRIAVAESGLFAPADLARMAGTGARCFLIGESLMRQDDVAAATRAILQMPAAAPA